MNRITISAAFAAAACGIAIPTVSALASSGSSARPAVRTPAVRLVDDHGRNGHGADGRVHAPSSAASSTPAPATSTHVEPGDDHGASASTSAAVEPGDDHGTHVEPGDARSTPAAPRRSTSHVEPGDDHGTEVEPGDDHSGRMSTATASATASESEPADDHGGSGGGGSDDGSGDNSGDDGGHHGSDG